MYRAVSSDSARVQGLGTPDTNVLGLGTCATLEPATGVGPTIQTTHQEPSVQHEVTLDAEVMLSVHVCMVCVCARG